MLSLLTFLAPSTAPTSLAGVTVVAQTAEIVDSSSGSGIPGWILAILVGMPIVVFGGSALFVRDRKRKAKQAEGTDAV